jgi:hypothetical protein
MIHPAVMERSQFVAQEGFIASFELHVMDKRMQKSILFDNMLTLRA